jgi:hypothetical protein
MTRFANRIALVPGPGTRNVDPRQVARVSAAIQRQVSEHFGPLWNIEATVDFFGRPEDVPVQYAPIYVLDRLANSRLGGYHKLDAGRPFALVGYDDVLWSVDASHEVLEMIVDPDGNNLIPGESPDPDLPGRAQFLVEICDPSGRENSAYKVDDIWVSDFHSPLYYDSMAVVGARYGYRDRLQRPKQLIKGGYLTWFDEARRQWFQRDYFGVRERTTPIDAPTFGQSLREHADTQSFARRQRFQQRNRRQVKRLLAMDCSQAMKAARARAERIDREVVRLRRRCRKGRLPKDDGSSSAGGPHFDSRPVAGKVMSFADSRLTDLGSLNSSAVRVGSLDLC